MSTAALDATARNAEVVKSDKFQSLKHRALGIKPTPADAAAEAAAAKKKADDAAAEAAKKKPAEGQAEADKKKAEADEKKKQETDAAAAAAAAKKPKAGPALPEAPQPGKDDRSVEQIVREVLPEIQGKEKGGVPPLDPEVQREIDLARFAETKHPEKYAGMAEKTAAFYSGLRDTLAAKAKELGGERSAEFQEWKESDDYKALIGQRPGFQRGDRTKLQEDMIADRARDEARRELEPKFKEQERRIAEIQHAPVIQQRTAAVYQMLVNDPRPEAERDPALVGFAQNPEKFATEHPEEARLIAQEAAETTELAREIYRIDLNLVDVNLKQPAPAHQAIRQFSRNLNDELRSKHPTGVVVGDKILIDADTYHARKLDRDPRYRVLDANEIAGALVASRAEELRQKLAQRREGITKSIYAPKPAAGEAGQGGQAKPAAEEETASPAAGSTSAPGTRTPAVKDAWSKTRDKYLNGK